MKQTTKHFIGIDVSKPWFDVSLMPVINHEKQQLMTKRFGNTPAGIKSLDQWLKAHRVSFDENSLLVIENTGVYHRLIWQYCSKKNLPLHIGNAAHIKWSMGITRGKNDPIDSQRLCSYAFKNADELKSTPALDPVLMQLKDLMTARTHLLTKLCSLRNYLKELRTTHDKATQHLMEQTFKQAIEGLKKSIAQTEKNIRAIIDKNEAIKKNYCLLLSVPGIGHLTAVYIICCTHNFVCKISGKQLACYAGVVPFKNSSGTSIKGKDKVHKMANKDLKTKLTMCALSAITYYPEFRQYYDRKTAQGKHPQAVLNAIKNKLLLRAVSVVNNQTPYVNKLQQAA